MSGMGIIRPTPSGIGGLQKHQVPPGLLPCIQADRPPAGAGRGVSRSTVRASPTHMLGLKWGYGCHELCAKRQTQERYASRREMEIRSRRAEASA